MSTPTKRTTSTTSTAKIIVWVALAVVVIVGIIALIVGGREDPTAEAPSAAASGEAAQVVRENSQVLSQAPEEKAVLVEFLDFECEACRAAYPFVEELRKDYSETVTFVHRYFPLPGHPNSMTAAIAVEAAAQQGQYDAMYQKMFETQEQWSHTTEDRGPVFRRFAENLGLDMAVYDAAVADPATEDRIRQDIADGTALGVSGTPTFFLDGQVLNPESLEQFRAQVDAAATS